MGITPRARCHGADETLRVGRAERGLGQAGQNGWVLGQIRTMPAKAPGADLNPALTLLAPRGDGLWMGARITVGQRQGHSPRWPSIPADLPGCWECDDREHTW